MDTFDIDRDHCGPMVLDALVKINDQIDPTLAFRRSCRRRVRLLRDEHRRGQHIGVSNPNGQPKKGTSRITPLPLMQVLKDLIPDLTGLYAQYELIEPWLQTDQPPPDRERHQSQELDGIWECILCLCCSTSRPSYWWDQDRYPGPSILLQSHRWLADSRDRPIDQAEAAARFIAAPEHEKMHVLGILSDHGAKSLIKIKSMLTEECGFRPYMASVGIEVIETDLGERIQQLDNEDPSHVVVPAVHKLRTDVAEVFAKTIGTDPANSDVHHLAEAQREATCPLILKADAGMTGCNFAVAETGTFVVCTNEGNADLSPMCRNCISHRSASRRSSRASSTWRCSFACCRSARSAPRSRNTLRIFAERGPAARCMSYWSTMVAQSGWAWRSSGPRSMHPLRRLHEHLPGLPAQRRPQLRRRLLRPDRADHRPDFQSAKYSNLPFASTLNGSCSNVCPVKINIHEQIYAWRRVLVERHETPLAKKAAMKPAGELVSRPAVYRTAISAADMALAHLPRSVIYNGLNAWGRQYEVPDPPNILASIRQNLPRVDRPLPAVPLFDDNPPASLLSAFNESLHSMGGVVLDPPASGDILAPVRAKIAGAKVLCSTVPEIAGNRDIASVSAAQDLADVDFAIVRAAFAVAETGSVPLSDADLRSNAVAYLAEHLISLLDLADIVVNLHHAYRRPEFRDRHYVTFHTCPSATADIEGVLIHGARGVRSLSALPLARATGDPAH
jgi:succinate dehydrogenase/fumarate reductase iron-sulfur protein